MTITPASVTGDVTVTGPDGFKRALTGTETLALRPGTYAVAAASVMGPHPIVGIADYVPAVTGATVTVTGGKAATATVSYVVQGSTGEMWVANVGAQSVLSFSADRLLTSTGAAPTRTISTGGVQYGAALDTGGNLWVSQTAANQIVKFTASQLAAGGAATPVVVLATNAGSISTGPASLSGPIGLAFDRFGTLWVANFNNNTVVGFAASQLASSGSPTPSVTLTGSLDEPAGLAFDANGNLWVASCNNNAVFAFSAAQRAAGNATVPAIILSSESSSLMCPFGLAFDRSGNLWVGNFNSNTVVEFTAQQLSAGGAPVPAATLNPVGVSLYVPAGLAFDASGDLWVANQFANTVVRFTPTQLRTGSPIPEVIVFGIQLASPAALVFNPPTGFLSRPR